MRRWEIPNSRKEQRKKKALVAVLIVVALFGTTAWVVSANPDVKDKVLETAKGTIKADDAGREPKVIDCSYGMVWYDDPYGFGNSGCWPPEDIQLLREAGEAHLRDEEKRKREYHLNQLEKEMCRNASQGEKSYLYLTLGIDCEKH